MRAALPEPQRLCTACAGEDCLPACLFAEIPGISGKIRMRIYSRDCTVFRQGEPATSVYVIRSGWIRETHTTNQGKMIRRILGPGSTMGAEAAITNTFHEMTADSIVESELLSIADWQFRALIDSHPPLAVDLLRKTSLKLKTALNDFFEIAGKKPSSQRLLESLQRRAQFGCRSGAEGIKLSLPFSIQDMADEIGCTRQWASKLFRQLETEGVAHRKGCWITLLTGQSGGSHSQKAGMEGRLRIASRSQEADPESQENLKRYRLPSRLSKVDKDVRGAR